MISAPFARQGEGCFRVVAIHTYENADLPELRMINWERITRLHQLPLHVLFRKSDVGLPIIADEIAVGTEEGTGIVTMIALRSM